jgi:hypothetical protein
MSASTKTFGISVALVVASCTAHVTGAVQVDGAPFTATTCRSGQANGFSGVELADATGQRLRLARGLNGTPAAVYFPAGSPVGDDLGACFTMNAQEGTGVVNGIRNVEGNAVLSCKTEKHQVSGSVQFDNCH